MARKNAMPAGNMKLVESTATVILKGEISSARSMQRQIESLKTQLKTVEEMYKPIETDLVKRIEAGWLFEAGCLPCAIDVKIMRHPKWKEICERHLGIDGAEQEAQKYPQVEYKRLVVND